MLAKSKEEEIKKYGSENVTFIDSELAEDEMEDELSRLMAGDTEEVSLEQAMRELELDA